MKYFVAEGKFCSHDLSRRFSHYRNSRGFCVGSELQCSVDNCPHVFLYFQELKKHTETKRFSDIELVAEPYSSVDNSFAAFMESDIVNEVEDDVNLFNSETLEKSLMHFLVKLQSKPNVTVSNVQTAAETLSGII
jgi:hypothetical protein